MAGIIILVLLGVLVAGYVMGYNRLQRLRVKVEEGYSGIDIALEKRFDLLTQQIETVKKYLNHEYKLFTDVTALRAGAEEEEQVRQRQDHLSEEAIKTIDQQIAQHTQSMEQIKRQLQQGAHTRGRHRRSARQQDAQTIATGQQQLAQATAQQSQSINQKVNVLASAHQALAGVGAGIDALAEQYPTLNSWISMDRFQLAIADSEEHLQAARRLYNSNVSIYNQTMVSIPWSFIASMRGMTEAEFYEVEERKRNFTVNFD